MMLQNEVRKVYRNKWIVFDSLKQHEEDNKYVKNMTLELNS